MENGGSIFSSGNILAYARRQASGELEIPEDLRARLELVCHAMEKNNSLNNLGRKVLIRQLAGHIVNHCAIRRALAENPGIARQALYPPILITELPRTGTSLLHRLMSLDEDNRTLKLHEALTPVRPEGQACRERYAETWSAFMNRIMPDTRHMIEVGPASPVECCFLKRNSLLCHSLGYQAGLGEAETGLLDRENLGECYDFYKLQLQLIQHQSPAGRWLLKCPSHFPALEQIYSRFPGVTVICTSREISEIISSFTSLISTIRSKLSTHLSKDAIAMELMRGIRLQIGMHRGFEYRQRTTGVNYTDLVADPIGCVSEIYRRNGFPYPAAFERKMSDWLRKNPHRKNGRHLHAPSMFGLSRKTIHEFFESAAGGVEDLNLANR